MISITRHLSISEEEIDLSAIRSQGSGGQHVNKVSTAIHLRFDIYNSSLPEALKQKLLSCGDHRLSDSGQIIIKAQKYRSQDKNKTDAINRLIEIIRKETIIQKQRRPTKPSKASKNRRMDKKTRHGQKKKLRQNNFD